MLRKGENCLLFPESHPRTDISPLAHLKCCPGEYIAVMDPPRNMTAGGIHLMARGDGWSDPHTVGAEKAEEDWNQSFKEAENAKVALDLDPLSFSMKKRFLALVEIAKSKYAVSQAYNEIQNPGAALDLRPDSYTVACVGAGIPLTASDRVMIAPYAAWRIKSMCGLNDVVVVGVDDPWSEITPLIYNAVLDTWEMMTNWVAVEMIMQERNVETNYRKFNNVGRVKAAGPNAESKLGELVALHSDRNTPRPNNTKWFGPSMGNWPRYTAFVREVDCEGTRRVLGTIEVRS